MVVVAVKYIACTTNKRELNYVWWWRSRDFTSYLWSAQPKRANHYALTTADAKDDIERGDKLSK